VRERGGEEGRGGGKRERERDVEVILPPDAILRSGGGNGGSVIADEGLDGSRDKLRRDFATTGIDPPRAESRVLPSEPGRLFVYPHITEGSIDKTIVFRGTDRDLARSLVEIPFFVIYIRYVGVGWS